MIQTGLCRRRSRSEGIEPLTSHRISASFDNREDVLPNERIEINPDIMDGKPVIRGTRIPVELVLRKLGAGMSLEAIMADHPRLTHDDILAAQAFAADYLAWCAGWRTNALRRPWSLLCVGSAMTCCTSPRRPRA